METGPSAPAHRGMASGHSRGSDSADTRATVSGGSRSTSSSTSTSTTSSAPQYSSDVRRPVLSLDMLPRQGSGSSNKTCEVDLGDEERDTFSPVSSGDSAADDVAAMVSTCNGDVASAAAAADNKVYDGNLPPLKIKVNNGLGASLHGTPSKEEKQRQNEEIVILETSSISSETGSWESVFPHTTTAATAGAAVVAVVAAAAAEVRNRPDPEQVDHREQHVKLAKHKERSPPERPRDVSGSGNARKEVVTEPYGRERTYSTGSTATMTACFIDAASLRDEDEVSSFPSLDGQQCVDGAEAALKVSEGSKLGDRKASERLLESPTKKLETFHKSFAKCKARAAPDGPQLPVEQSGSRTKSSSSCSSDDADLPQKGVSVASVDSASNLSDEEKLWKREHINTQTARDDSEVRHSAVARNTQAEGHTHSGAFGANDEATEATEASVSLVADVDSSDSSEIVKLRHEPDRRQASLPFHHHHLQQHHQQQQPQHPFGLNPVTSKPMQPFVTHVNLTHTAHSDLSYTTDYSSSSPAPSLVWSEHEHRSGRHALDDYEPHKQKLSRPPPETPHNSIVNIEPMSSNTSSIHRDYTLSSSFSHQRDSGAYCSDATDSPVPMPRTPKRSKFDEANPIVSGGVCASDFHVKQCDSPPVKRRTDACPIVSGGFVSLDFQHTRPLGEDDDDDDDDDAGDDGDEEEVELRVKPKTRKPIPGIASWVVDMSDCQRSERRKSTSSTSSLETSQSKFRERSDSNSSHKSGCGFYVSLDDVEKKGENPGRGGSRAHLTTPQMSKSYNAPKSAGFFVNLSASEYKPKEGQDAPTTQQTTELRMEGDPASGGGSQKNLFSMFIDIGGGSGGGGGSGANGSGDRRLRANGRKEPFSLAQRLTSSLASAPQRRPEEAPVKSNASSTETLMSKSSNLKTSTDNGNVADVSSSEGGRGAATAATTDHKGSVEPPITVAAIRRLSQQQRTQNETAKRHSWSNNQHQGPAVAAEYKRSISLTANNEARDSKGQGLMSIIDKLPIISKTSSLSVDSSLSTFDEYTGSKSELSSSSNVSARNSMSGGEREEEAAPAGANGGAGGGGGRIKKRRRDVQINETFDKSSLASITDGILSKDLSPASTTDTDDLTFQQDEELAMREAAALQQQQQQQQGQPQPQPQPPLLPSGQASGSGSRLSTVVMETIIETKETSSPKKSAAAGHTMETLHATIEKQKMLLETVNENVEAEKAEKASFVKLSDMDKPMKLDVQSPEGAMSKSVGNHRQINRLFRDESRARPHSWTMTRSTGNSFLNITNSVENLRSLSRLFPNFSKEYSNSLPNDMIHEQFDYIQTDLSADSSLASSISRSGMDESSISCRQPRRLGEDLLKMFLQEIATDMIVEVHGRRIKAHKCILRSRCQYFAAVLAGNVSQSVVSLQGYSFPAVHFALCHIYSGASHPPDGISLMELAALADLLGLEGLKEVTAHALKTNYCHNFHKPCSGCIDGILQVLPVALNHALDDLYRKCLRWTCRHYLKVWPTRQFAQLPSDILGRCRQQIIAYLTSESVLDTVLDCDNLVAQLSSYRWGGVCENLVRDILEAANAYMADHFASLIASDSFLSLGHDRSCHIPRLEGVLLRTASSLTPDQACRSYQRVTRLNTVLQAKVIQMPTALGDLAKELQGLQEEDLDWDPEYIRLVSSILSAVEQCLIRQCSRAMRVTAWQRMDLDLRKKIQTLARLTEPLDLKRSKPVSKAFSFGGSTRNQDLQQVKLAIQAHTRRALAQDTHLFKATQTQDTGNVQTTERGVQANNEPREGTSKILKSNSRVHVPQSLKATTQSTTTTLSDRNSNNINAGAHRRTKSEVPMASSNIQKVSIVVPADRPKGSGELKSTDSANKPKGQPLRLADVRPRYLEPRKTPAVSGAAGPVRSSTSSCIPATLKKQAHPHSSSESSRHSSPAARKYVLTIGKVSSLKSTTNKSLDNLTSASNLRSRSKGGKCSDNDRFSDACIDSMGDSMKSSVITNKTASQESLVGSGKVRRSRPLVADSNKQPAAAASRQVEKAKPVNGAAKPVRPTSLAARPPKYLKQQKVTSTGSSPSSVTTTKSATSRLSSVSSNRSSRDLFKQRSISVPGQEVVQSNTNTNPSSEGQRRSFLSAKSREILAKRAEKEKQQRLEQRGKSQEPPTDGANVANSHLSRPAAAAAAAVMRSASNTSVTQGRSSMPSNIPTRRPNTLHLKKTNGFNLNKGVGGGGGGNASSNHKLRNINGATEVHGVGEAVKHKIELLIKTSAIVVDNACEEPSLAVESKLERSSTFCKESADISDRNELQIIE